MIKIRKDNDEKFVTKGVYNSVFKRLGYEVVTEKTTAKEVKVVEPKVAETKVIDEKAAIKDVIRNK